MTESFYEKFITPLMLSCRFENLDKVKEVVEAHPEEVNKVNEHDGWTPLIHAIEGNNLDIVEYLISKDANVNHYDRDGWTPLFHAQVKRRSEIELLLRKHGGELPSMDKINEIMKNYIFDLNSWKNERMGRGTVSDDDTETDSDDEEVEEGEVMDWDWD